jgi:hypothetical protein
MSSTPEERKEQGVAIATSVVDSLRNQPLLLTLVVMQFLVMAFLYFGVTEGRKRDHLLSKFILERCLPTAPTAPT